MFHYNYSSKNNSLFFGYVSIFKLQSIEVNVYHLQVYSSKNYEKKWNLKYPFSRLEVAGTFHIAE